ncbi:nuclear transport factor 2 family protein [Sphingomonas sp. RB1R13]|uniref:nuclear transport factor 2 family protein n=1 Tax=Sphingomonas sp. RB1R13 TaxID=3096159 RepID=UPI002FC71AE8
MIGDDETAVLEHHAAGRFVGGEAYANRYAACFTVRGGKVTEVRPYNDTKRMLALISPNARD